MSLLERRLILVSGKGGVGKSTVTAALATLAARAGLKVLLCELERGGRLERIFNGDSSSKNITLLYIDPEAALEEYLKIYLKVKPLYKPIAQSPAMNYFLQAAPGFRELLIIGKIWWEVQLKEGKAHKHKWDMVLVDAPATGHGISFMGVAQAVAEMVKIGPIHNQAQRMVKTLQDKKTTALVPVTLPEEMPINETVELISRAKDSIGVNIGPVVVNCMPSQVFPLRELTTWRELEQQVKSSDSASPELRALVTLARMGRKRRELAIAYRRQLRESLPEYEMIDIPFLSRWSWNIETVNEIAGYLQRSLDI